MELRHLQYFVAVAETGSISKAAEKLDLAQPTLTRQIVALERELDCALLVRHPRGVTVTEPGAILLEHGKDLLRRVAEARDDTQERARVASGTAGIGAPPSLAEITYAPLAKRYLARCPGVTLRFAEGLSYVLLDWLDSGRIDIAVLTNAQLGKGYRVAHLLTEPVFVLCPRDHALTRAKGPTRSIVDVARYRLIASSPFNRVRRMAASAATAAGVTLDVGIESENPATVKALVEAGQGLALLSYSGVARDLESGRFAGFQVDGLRHERVLVQRRDRAPGSAVRELVEALVETVAELHRGGQYGDPALIVGPRLPARRRAG